MKDASPPPLEVPTASENEENEEGGGPELEEVEPALIKDDGGAGPGAYEEADENTSRVVDRTSYSTSDDDNATLESGELTL